MKTGYGLDVCKILKFLMDKIFTEKKLGFKQPVFPKAQEEKIEQNIDELEEEEGLREQDDDLDEIDEED